jgi:transcriptional regulator with XRE-family HTH domain
MNNINDLLNEIIADDKDIQTEIELLDLKYMLIDELIKYRKSYKLSQSDFANKINVKQQMISRFEKGEVDPRLSFISKILMGMRKDIIVKDKDYINVVSLESKKKKKHWDNPPAYVLVTG